LGDRLGQDFRRRDWRFFTDSADVPLAPALGLRIVRSRRPRAGPPPPVIARVFVLGRPAASSQDFSDAIPFRLALGLHRPAHAAVAPRALRTPPMTRLTRWTRSIVPSTRSAARAAALALVLPVALAGCKAAPKPTVEEPKADPWAETTGPALVKLGPNDPKPDVAAAFANKDMYLDQALDRSVQWFQAPSSRQFFPFYNQTTTEVVTTHEQAAASVLAFKDALATSTSADEFRGKIDQMFDIWQSVGYDADRNVLYTGYYSPEFRGSRVRTAQFQYPLYKRPADLLTDPVSGEPLGRRMPDGTTSTWPTRGEIEASDMFAGTELVWVESKLDAYIIHVNGSAKIFLPDNTIMYIGYAGKTDREYFGLGKAMVDAGLIPKEKLSLRAIRDYHKTDPARVEEMMNRNESYVFFTEYDGKNWPAGSLGVKVHEKATLATDKKIFPRGGVVMVDTISPTIARGPQTFQRFLLDQDTGGAIRAAGRADIYMGTGAAAELLAGGQFNDGKLYYFILKPEYVSQYPLPMRPSSGPARRGPGGASTGMQRGTTGG
jgi:membrane-bound lytic murein transglycosylase A